MFERRRKGGKAWMYGSGSAALTILSTQMGSGKDNSKTGPVSGGRTSADGGTLAVMAGVSIGVPLVVGIVNLKAYSEKYEAEVEQLYRAGQPLPKKIRQRMKKKDLEPYD